MEIENVQRVKLLGVYVDIIDMLSLNEIIKYSISNRKKWIIANHNLHSVYLYHYVFGMSDFYAIARFVHIDGMILVGIGKLLGLPLFQDNRISYVDWMLPLMKIVSENSWRVYYLGSNFGVAARGARMLQMQFPRLEIKTHHGYFDTNLYGEDNAQIVEEINQFKPDILMVGMGMPRQEKWILENLKNLDVYVILNAGACIDYFAGEVPVPPRWLGKIGMEWTYRLVSNPKYFWRRYLFEPWFLLKYFFWDFYYFIKRKVKM